MKATPSGIVSTIAIVTAALALAVAASGCADRAAATSPLEPPPLPSAPGPAAPAVGTNPVLTARAPQAATQPAAPKPPLRFELEVSQRHIRDFVLLRKRRYRERELGPLFRQMRRRGDLYCGSVWSDTWTFESASRFISRHYAKWYYRPQRKVGGKNIIAGCWNYFFMNDQKPHRDFLAVKKLYPTAGASAAAPHYDCYATAFMQPYLMHSILGCRHLTMVDFDWRILDGHYQLLQHFRKGGVTDAAQVRDATRSLVLSWVAFSGKGVRPRHVADHSELCKRVAQGPLCLKHLLGFQRRFGELRSIDLRIASFHDAELGPSRPRGLKVIFLSNIAEPLYTTRGQFRTMLRAVTRSLGPGQRAVFIHHVGGHPAYGIYELRRSPQGRPRVRTRCTSYPDRWVVGSLPGRRYHTYFDRLSENKKAPDCNALLAE